MLRSLSLFAVTLILLAPTLVAAEPIPDYALNKDYENCLGDQPNDHERQAYCHCVREGMRGWDLDTYGDIAMQQIKTGKAPAQIEMLAKGCVDKVLK